MLSSLLRRGVSCAACLALFALSIVPAHAQVPAPEPAEWGEVSRDALEMERYPADSNAAAVILSDVGNARFRFNGEVEFERHVRIKILNEGGYDWGTVALTYFDADRIQRIKDVEGQTFVLNDAGEVERHELDGDDIFEEELDEKREQIRFTLPNLEAGAVIEYSYKLRSKTFRIPSWEFQRSEPTLYSEYNVRIPEILRYVTLSRGTLDFDVQESDWTQGSRGSVKEMRWVMKDVPALREEPYMTTPDDYRSTLQLQVSAVLNPRTMTVATRILSTWPDAAEGLLQADYFGADLGSDRDVRKQAEALVRGANEEAEKMQAIYDYVRTEISWDGRKRHLLSSDLDDVLEAKSGSSADVNLLLTSMLQEIGLKAHPVLTSTRDHGRMYTAYPIMDQFNYVLTAVQVDGTWRLLDATEKDCPASLLPKRALNREGWLVREDKPAWLAVPAPTTDHHKVFINAELTEDGTITGTVNANESGYSALSRRGQLRDGDAATVIDAQVLDGVTEVTVEQAEVTNLDAIEKPLKMSAQFEAPAAAQAAGDFIYVSPFLAMRESENPFQLKDRSFPVDFGHPQRTTFTLTLKLPDGYTVTETPSNAGVELPEKAGSFARVTQTAGNRIMMRAALQLSKPVFEPSQYSGLRDFFDRVVAAQAEQIVLQRTDAASSAPSDSTDATSTSDASDASQ